jgi:catechol 2,3-dioxygenase-like lactoylglutathione lyase family enzyme
VSVTVTRRLGGPVFAPEKLLHVVQGAQDSETRRALENRYLDVFAAQTYYEARPVKGLDRDETLALIGELCLIVQNGLNLDTEWNRLRAEYAGRFAQMAIKVPDTESTAAHFREHGLNPIDVHPNFKSVFFMTDPKETLNVRFELCARNMPNDLRLRQEWSAAWWRDGHPLRIEKLSSVVTATDDLAAATRFYKGVFGLQQLGGHQLPEVGASSASFAIGSEAPFVIEVWQPSEDGTPLAEYVAKFGGGIYALSFKVASLEAARGYLESKGLRIAGDSERRVVIEPNDTGGSTFMMVEQELA